MYNFSEEVNVKVVERNRRILIDWSAYGVPTTVEWIFIPRPDNTTFVSITNTGFSGDLNKVAEEAIGSTEGFTLVFAGLKALVSSAICRRKKLIMVSKLGN
jgi:uncharacterized protein YndB with AHSA1/START domain